MPGTWEQPVYCNSCGALFAEAEISPDELGLLADIEQLRQFRSEVDLIQRYDDLCQRYPPLWKLLQPDFSSFIARPPPLPLRLELAIGRPLPPDDLLLLERHGYGPNPHRRRFVRERIEELTASVGDRNIRCLRCGSGILRLDTDKWLEPGVHHNILQFSDEDERILREIHEDRKHDSRRDVADE